MFTFSETDVRRISTMLKDFESRSTPVPPRQLPNWQHVRITGDVVYDGQLSGSSSGGTPYYPGIVVKLDASRKEDVELGEVWVRDWNEAELSEGFVYSCQQTGNIAIQGETRTLFMTEGSAGGANAIIIKTIDCLEVAILTG